MHGAAIIVLRWEERAPVFGKALLFAALALSVAWYTLVNRPGDGTSTGDAYAVHQRRGAYIAGIARPDELICVSGAEVGTQLIFYAHRNIEPIDAADVRAGRFPDVSCSIIWFDFADDGSCTVHRRPRHGGSSRNFLEGR